MKSYKHRVHSSILRRPAHADVFATGDAPRFPLVLFGGSGVDEEEYDRRSGPVVPFFGPALEQIDDRPDPFVLVHVTAPYDVPFARFSREPAAAERRNAHVSREILEGWSGLPHVVGGLSGGLALALHGLQRGPRCFGAAGLGADAIPPDFECPAPWTRRLWLDDAPEDRVWASPENRRITDRLVRRGQAEVLRLRGGRHRLADYATAECLGSLLRTVADHRPQPA